MRIVYLIAATCNSGGMERVLANKANWLVSHGYDVSIVTTDQRGRASYFPLDEHITTYDLDINYDADNGRLLSKLVHYPVRQWQHRRRLEALLMRLKADVVVCMFNNDVSFVHKIHDGSRKVLEIHFSKNKKLQYGRRGLWALADRWRTRQEEKLVRKYDRFAVLTHEDAALWGNLPNMVVIPNSGPAPQPRPVSEGSSDHSRRVLAIGRYDYQKGFDRLIRIWKRVQAFKGSSVQGWQLDIVGDGPLRDELQQQIERLRLTESVHLVPPTSDILSLYHGSSIFVLTSRYEGLPMVLIEAQTYGLPIVSFACPCGPRDVIKDGVNGFLIEGEDEALFAERLTTLMNDPALRQRMGQAALQASEHFSEEHIMSKWQEVMKNRQLLVVSAVNLRKGGTLSILRDCLRELSEAAQHGDVRVVALVHNRQLCAYPGIEYIELPWSVRSWVHRLWCEYVTMHGISRRLGDIDLWLSLHDTTPRVTARRRAVYCHNSYPFFHWHWHHLWQNYRIVCFALFTKLFYRINLHRNAFVIVQSQWFRNAFQQMFKLERNKIVVFPPKDSPPALPVREGAECSEKVSALQSLKECSEKASALQSLKVTAPSLIGRAGGESVDSATFTFLYPAFPDVHKNFECLCEAARLLEEEVGEGRFEVLLTTSPDFNRYSRWLHRRWGHVKSIHFCGFLPKEELDALYAKASCLVFPSQVETWGLPISEFAQSGRPMLLADRPYAHETAGGSTLTAFFNPDSPETLMAQMRSILQKDTSFLHPIPVCHPQPPHVKDWTELIHQLLH